MIKFNQYIAPSKMPEEIISRKGHDSVRYLNTANAFDIETSSYHDADNNKRAIMYIWMMGIDDQIVYGRTWGEFQWFLHYLKEQYQLGEHKRMVIYVHNLSFEFQFLRTHFHFVDCLTRQNRNVFKVFFDEFGLEFRDSLILSGMSLAKTAENLTEHTIKKLKGDLDYNLIRLPCTPITPEQPDDQDRPGTETPVDPENPGNQDPENPGGQDPENPGNEDPENPGGEEPDTPVVPEPEEPQESYYVEVAENFSDWSGDYLITYTSGSTVLVLNSHEETKGYGVDISSTLTAQGIHSDDGDQYKAVVEKSGNGYTINVAGIGYLGLENAKNSVNASATPTKIPWLKSAPYQPLVQSAHLISLI